MANQPFPSIMDNKVLPFITLLISSCQFPDKRKCVATPVVRCLAVSIQHGATHSAATRGRHLDAGVRLPVGLERPLALDVRYDVIDEEREERYQSEDGSHRKILHDRFVEDVRRLDVRRRAGRCLTADCYLRHRVSWISIWQMSGSD